MGGNEEQGERGEQGEKEGGVRGVEEEFLYTDLLLIGIAVFLLTGLYSCIIKVRPSG